MPSNKQADGLRVSTSTSLEQGFIGSLISSFTSRSHDIISDQRQEKDIVSATEVSSASAVLSYSQRSTFFLALKTPSHLLAFILSEHLNDGA